MRIQQVWRGYLTPCGEVTKAVARLLSLLWRGYQICGEITCGEVTLWRGDSQVTGDSPIFRCFFCGNLAIRLTLYKSGTGYSLHEAPETPDNTIHWPNAVVMLGHCLRRLANIISIKTLYGLITVFNQRHIFYLNTT